MRNPRARYLAWLPIAALLLLGGGIDTAWALATTDGVVSAPVHDIFPPSSRPHPRLKLSAGGFSIANLDRSPVPLTGAHLNVYPLSERWMRGGFGFEVGRGKASAVGNNIALIYGLMGLTAGVQYPARVTPFLEGHVSGGVLSGRLDGTINVGGTSVSGAAGTTWLYGRGIDLGAELYVANRVYLSAALGWTRSTWGAPDLTAQVQNPQSNPRLVDMTSDSLLWKLGIGI